MMPGRVRWTRRVVRVTGSKLISGEHRLQMMVNGTQSG